MKKTMKNEYTGIIIKGIDKKVKDYVDKNIDTSILFIGSDEDKTRYLLFEITGDDEDTIEFSALPYSHWDVVDFANEHDELSIFDIDKFVEEFIQERIEKIYPEAVQETLEEIGIETIDIPNHVFERHGKKPLWIKVKIRKDNLPSNIYIDERYSVETDTSLEREEDPKELSFPCDREIYNIIINEIRTAHLEIEAVNEESALDMARNMYNDSVGFMNHADITDVDFSIE